MLHTCLNVVDSYQYFSNLLKEKEGKKWKNVNICSKSGELDRSSSTVKTNASHKGNNKKGKQRLDCPNF